MSQPQDAFVHSPRLDTDCSSISSHISLNNHSGAVQNKNGTSWVPGNVYISHTVDYKGTPVPPPRQAFKHLYWVDGLETHRPRGVEDGTFYFYLKVDDAAEALPEIAYSGMKEEARAIIDVTYALLPPQLLSYDVVWGKELGAARRLSGWPEVKQFMSLASH